MHIRLKPKLPLGIALLAKRDFAIQNQAELGNQMKSQAC